MAQVAKDFNRQGGTCSLLFYEDYLWVATLTLLSYAATRKSGPWMKTTASYMRGPPTGKTLIVYRILGAIFLFTGIGLIKAPSMMLIHRCAGHRS